jgi:hypothetical protein
MSFLFSGFTSAEDASNDPSISETIQVYIDRLLTSTFPEDRRASLLGLKSFAKTHKNV